MAPILSRTPLAAYTFVDTTGKKNIRVCFQDKVGNIKQAFFRQGDGWHKRDHNLVGKATLNNGMAITGWNNGTAEVTDTELIWAFEADRFGIFL